MSPLRGILVLLMSLAALPAAASVIYLGGSVDARAYSGFASQAGSIRDTLTVDSLPFLASSSVTSGNSTSTVDYNLKTSPNGAVFQWDFSHVQDGGFDSVASMEGELQFQLDAETEVTLEGTLAYAGGWNRHGEVRIYDSLLGTETVLNWVFHEATESDGTLSPQAAALLVPDKSYRLTYRFLADAGSSSVVGSVAGGFSLSIGAPGDVAQPGDANGDGRVDLADLNLVRNHFGQAGDPAPGDTSPFDGRVDLADLNSVRNFFGQSLPTNVPEPASASLAAIGCVAAFIARSRRAGR